MKKLFKIKVLDTTYTVFESNQIEDDTLIDRDAYVSYLRKEIVIDETKNPHYKNHLLNHELVHAFLFECGLADQTWSGNEEIVDWIALQSSKLNNVLNESKGKLFEYEYKKN